MASACSISLSAPFAACLSVFPSDPHAWVPAGGYPAQGWVSDTALYRHCLMSVSSWMSPHSPPASHHDPWCQLTACSSRHYCHSYWQAGHFQNISVGRWCILILAPFLKSLNHHPLDTPSWFLSGLAGADITHLLISSPEALNSNARLPLSFIFFSHSPNRAPFKWLLLYIHFAQIKKMFCGFRNSSLQQIPPQQVQQLPRGCRCHKHECTPTLHGF